MARLAAPGSVPRCACAAPSAVPRQFQACAQTKQRRTASARPGRVTAVHLRDRDMPSRCPGSVTRCQRGRVLPKVDCWAFSRRPLRLGRVTEEMLRVALRDTLLMLEHPE
ncbi:hypothetical protein HAX54_009580 [Datura stramonium]|uniref:Uncharacterized protein n=1 Tax=Datura stramonium TaxID=4076 RepID=A0ABS8TGN2_DATST|nr:hypothetical protein [Datura stramonium]